MKKFATGMLYVYSLTENLVAFTQGLVKDAIQVHLHILHAPHMQVSQCSHSVSGCTEEQISCSPNRILVNFSATFICVAKQRGCILMFREQ